MTSKQRRWRVLRVTLLVALLSYLGVATFGGCADRLILKSWPAPIPTDADRTMIPFRDGVLEVWRARSPGATSDVEPKAFVLDFMGQGSRAEPDAGYVAQRWGARPVEVWSMNYPGYGGSTGPPRLAEFAPAALAVYDELRLVAGDRPIFVGGHSLGTTSALYLARHRDVAGLFLHNPPALKSVILGEFGWWNLWLIAGPVALQIPNDLDSPANARFAHAPAVFAMARGDTWVPPRYQHMVFDAYAGPTFTLDLVGADHNTPIEQVAPAELQHALDWLWQQAGLSDKPALNH